ncbi:MAG: hypothetical protein HOF35_12945 [Bacteroidetes bacterium]|nr:hypothetical protein [Bacteroidota bacterium]
MDPLASNYNPDAIYDDGSCSNIINDIDGNYYETVIIGEQEWMAENLKVTHYRNGDEIPTGFNGSDWSELSTGAFAVYNDDPANADTYGNLYNWYAADDDRGICPDEWHIPTDEEWMELEMYLGMSYEDAQNVLWRGTDQGSQLAGSADLWNSGELENDPQFGSSGFIALPGGHREEFDGNYYSIGNNGYFWSKTEYGNNNAWHRIVSNNNSEIFRNFASSPYYGFSIRCLKDDGLDVFGCTDIEADNFNPDATENDGSCEYSCIDIDGNSYETVVIGEQIWMAENLRVTHYNNGDEIPTNYSNSQWSALSIGAFAVYNDDPFNMETYCNLYNWYAVDDYRGICPEEFHAPSDEDWTELTDFLGESAGSQLAGDADLWNIVGLVNNPAFGTSGFGALPGGYRNDVDGICYSMGDGGYFWSSTASGSDGAWSRRLYYYTSEVDRLNHSDLRGFSIRCLRD